MLKLIIIFIVIALIIAVFCCFVVGREIALDKKEREEREEERAQEREKASSAPTPIYIPVPTPQVAESKPQTAAGQKAPVKRAKRDIPPIAVAFPSGKGEESENGIFPKEWKMYRKELLRYLAGFQGMERSLDGQKETYLKNGRPVLKCYFVSNGYNSNLTETNRIREEEGCSVINITSTARLNMAKKAIYNTIRG